MKQPRVVASSQQALDQFKPWRDRMVRHSRVACPKCGAVPGVLCVSATGKDLPSGHRDRRRVALREQAAGDPS